MIIHKPKKALVLRIRDPNRILSVIPKSRLLRVKGKEYVAVKHGVEEVQVLRNIGIDAPSPIEYYYEWPGRFTPFAHQVDTAAFMTLANRCFNLNGMGCIAGDERVRVSRKGKSIELPLRALFKKFHGMPDKDSWKARSLLGDHFGMNRLDDVLFKGNQQTLRFTLEDGKQFKCTPDHRIARPDGSWTEAGKLVVGDALVTNGALRVSVPCPSCGGERLVGKYSAKKARAQVCRACKGVRHSETMRGEKNPSWKGGRFKDPDGYIRLNCPEHHRADNHGYVYEHIFIAEGGVGHPITSDYHVHHINGLKDDNRPENLEVLLAADHHREHRPYFNLDGAVSGKGGVVVATPKISRVVSIEDGGMQDVYDLCMGAPHHNFVVNGVVVHNSGKTISTLWAFDYLRSLDLVRKALVISPLSTLERTWADEVFNHFPHLTATVLYGAGDRRLKLLDTDADLFLINHDGIKVKGFVEAMKDRPDIDLIVIDEVAQVARNAGTDRFRALHQIVNKQHPRKAWGLTGTPIPNQPTDAWAQCRLLVPERVPPYFNRFKDQVMRQVSQFVWLPRPGAIDVVHDAMQPAIRYSLDECIDLPPCIYETRQVELSKAQAKAYKDMLTKLKAEADAGAITAVNEAVKAQKLIQIATGCAYGEDGQEVVFDPGPRLAEVNDVVESAGTKVIVFVPFVASVRMVADYLREQGHTVECIYGEVTKNERDRILSAFQKERDPKVLVAQPATMSHGLTLTAANTIVWYAPITSADIYAQANARVRRPGQSHTQLIVNIEGADIERRFFKRLRDKQAVQGVLLELVREQRN